MFLFVYIITGYCSSIFFCLKIIFSMYMYSTSETHYNLQSFNYYFCTVFSSTHAELTTLVLSTNNLSAVQCGHFGDKLGTAVVSKK